MCLVSVVQAALNACTQLGGSICVPAGTYTISMPDVHHQLATDICLAIPSDCTLFGEGAASILEFSTMRYRSVLSKLVLFEISWERV